MSFALGPRAFAHWDAAGDRWSIARGCHAVQVGWSSRAIVARARIAVGGARCGGAAISLPR